MKVKMTEAAPGSPDGVRVLQYEQGEEYDVPVVLARLFVAAGQAEALEELPEGELESFDPAREELSYGGAAEPIRTGPAPSSPNPAEQTAEGETAVDYSKLKAPALKAELDARGIAYKKGAVANAALVALLIADDAAAEPAGEGETGTEETGAAPPAE